MASAQVLLEDPIGGEFGHTAGPALGHINIPRGGDGRAFRGLEILVPLEVESDAGGRGQGQDRCGRGLMAAGNEFLETVPANNGRALGTTAPAAAASASTAAAVAAALIDDGLDIPFLGHIDLTGRGGADTRTMEIKPARVAPLELPEEITVQVETLDPVRPILAGEYRGTLDLNVMKSLELSRPKTQGPPSQEEIAEGIELLDPVIAQSATKIFPFASTASRSGR